MQAEADVAELNAALEEAARKKAEEEAMQARHEAELLQAKQAAEVAEAAAAKEKEEAEQAAKEAEEAQAAADAADPDDPMAAMLIAAAQKARAKAEQEQVSTVPLIHGSVVVISVVHRRRHCKLRRTQLQLVL